MTHQPTRSAGLDNALQNAGHALMLPDTVPALARVLAQFRDEHRKEVRAEAAAQLEAAAARQDQLSSSDYDQESYAAFQLRDQATALRRDSAAPAAVSAAEPQPQVPEPLAALLATPCATCDHTLNWHRHHVGCIAHGCGCGRFEEQPDAEADEADLTAEQQVRGVQAWMALDLHQALGWPVDHGATVVHQGRKSWSDWWAELLAGVRNVQMMRRYRGEVQAPAVVSAAVAPPTDPTHGLSVQHADALLRAVAIPGPHTPTYPEQHERVCRAVRDILDELTPARDEADQTALRDRIAEALAREDAHNAGYDHGFVGSYGADDETDGFVDAVLAVLPEAADWDALVREAGRLRRDGKALHARAEEIDNQLTALRQQITEPTNRAVAEAALAAVEAALGDTLLPDAREEALAGLMKLLPLADRAAVLADVERAIRAATGSCGYKAEDGCDFCNGVDAALVALRRMADETATETPEDTLPAWLYQRFMPDGIGWDQLDEDDRSYWEHQARAVRRAVARGGFKQPAAGARQDGTQP